MTERTWLNYTLAELAKLSESTIETIFKKESRQLTSKRKHEIRKQILQKENMTRMVSFTDDLKVKYDRISFEYKEESEAVFLKTCENYHATHIKVVARKLIKSEKGEYICDVCGNKCNSTSELMHDAFMMSYYENVKNFEGATIILNRKPVGSVAQRDQEVLAEVNENTTVIAVKGEFQLVTIKILQIVNDEELKSMNKDHIAHNIERASDSIITAEFEAKELALFPSQMLSNLIDFESAVRIRNPLLHRNCRPADHNGRLIFYSFQHVYHKIFEQKAEGAEGKKGARSRKTNVVKCIMPSCVNQFDRQNFEEVAIMVNSIRSIVYQQEKQCMFGEYFNSHYTKNWHTSNAESRILSFVNKNTFNRYRNQIKTNVYYLTTASNLAEGKKKFLLKSKKKVIQNYNKDKDGLKGKNDIENVIAIDLGSYNLCPTRCRSCPTLNSQDAFFIAYHYQSSPERKCICCQTANQKKSFTDCFYIDLEQMKFIFFEGHATQVYFDVVSRKYFHKMSFYTGNSLRNKLKKQEKTYSGDIRKSDISIKLDKQRRYVPFIDSRCSSNTKETQNINKHFIFLSEDSKGSDIIRCGVDGCEQNLKPIRSDYLIYCEELDLALRSYNNNLQWKGNTESKQYSNVLSITSLKFYSDIKREVKNLDEQHNISDFFARNYQGEFIEYPFRFRQCRHSFESSICDFKDLLYQMRVEKKTQFQCRYKTCEVLYQNADDLQRLPFEVLGSFEGKQDLLRQANSKNNYWLKYDFVNGEILELVNPTPELREQEQNYRLREWKTEPESKKTINFKISKLAKDIFNLQEKVKEDRSNIEQNKPLRHFEDTTMMEEVTSDIEKKKNNLDELKKQKQILVSKQLADTRAKKDTSYVNFGRLSELFPQDIRELQSLKRQPERQEVEEVVIDNIRTYGNISVFKYPVPRFTSLLPERKEEARSLIDEGLKLMAQEKKKTEEKRNPKS